MRCDGELRAVADDAAGIADSGGGSPPVMLVANGESAVRMPTALEGMDAGAFAFAMAVAVTADVIDAEDDDVTDVAVDELSCGGIVAKPCGDMRDRCGDKCDNCT